MVWHGSAEVAWKGRGRVGGDGDAVVTGYGVVSSGSVRWTRRRRGRRVERWELEGRPGEEKKKSVWGGEAVASPAWRGGTRCPDSEVGVVVVGVAAVDTVVEELKFLT
ncbi:hypothetical protein Salat_2241400 [Sesamum alatum]|uniref:Uncharacterized protein n=1 Tax=Sesamum alatum TaxID=300844 RepID=A0AAE1XVC9_9LAMI|nr:hypothetical protein Salat_2241400 [Sesamum alatum]